MIPTILRPSDRGSVDAGAESTAISEDTMFELLGNERRRSCLKLLSGSDGEWEVSSLSERVATDVTDEPSAAEDVYDSVYISLCQTHLPKLDEAGLVEYDAERKTVTLGPRADGIRQYWFVDGATSDEPDTALSLSVLVSVCTVVGLGVATVVPSISGPVTAGIVALQLVVLLAVARQRLRATE